MRTMYYHNFQSLGPYLLLISIDICASANQRLNNTISRYWNSQCHANGMTLVCNNVVAIPPASYYINIKELYLRNSHRFEFRPDDLRAHNSLEILHLHSVRVHRTVPKDIFSSLVNLKEFHFENSNLTQQWHLPKNLQHYSVVNNSYTYLNLSMCPRLETVLAENNRLKTLPLFSHQPPPLKKLNLRNNPVQRFTVQDIASLCHLAEFQFQIPETFLADSDDACECLRLFKWKKIFKISGLDVTCPVIMLPPNCSLSLDDVVSRRKRCLNQTSSKTRQFKYYTSDNLILLVYFVTVVYTFVVIISIFAISYSFRILWQAITSYRASKSKTRAQIAETNQTERDS